MQVGSDLRTSPEEKSSADHAEILDAINSLSKLELSKLARFAHWRIFGIGVLASGLEASDLLHEAFASTLSGQRRWSPGNVTLYMHLIGAMRSISSAWAAKAINEARMPTDEVEPDTDGSRSITPFFSAPSYEPNPESQASARQLEVAIANAIRSDEQASKVLLTMLDGCTDGEAPAAAGLTFKEYEAAKKRVRRRMLKIMQPPLKRAANQVP